MAPTRYLVLAACLAGLAVPAPVPAEAGSSSSVTVFAAASLTEAFTKLGKILEARNPGIGVTFDFAGSQQLALEIEQGASADVFASADERWMQYLARRGLLRGAPREFARNRLAVVLPRANPAGITRLQDLARPGLKCVIAVDAVPAGHYARQILAKLSAAPGFDRDYASRVLANVVSEEDNVRSVVAKVLLGEADAGIVYRSDVTPQVADRIRVVQIPDQYNVLAAYPIAILKNTHHRDGAQAFVDLTLSHVGRQVLRDYAFLP